MSAENRMAELGIADFTNWLNCSGTVFKDCDINAQVAPAFMGAAGYKNCTFVELTQECSPLELTGNCEGMVISGSGDIVVKAGGRIDGLKLDDFRGTLYLEEGARLNSPMVTDSCLLQFQAGNNVTISNGRFDNTIFSYCDFNATGVTFDSCQFVNGTQINPSCKGGTFINCAIDRTVGCKDAELHLASNIVDLQLIEPNGSRRIVENLSELGLPERDCRLSPQAQMNKALAGISGVQMNPDLPSGPAAAPDVRQPGGPDLSRLS